MLKLTEDSGTEKPDRHTKFKLFEHSNTTGPSGLIPQNEGPRASCCSHKRYPVDDDMNEGHSDASTPNTVAWLPPLLANEALAQAVSHVRIQMGGWAPLHIFKLFVVLVEPPLGLDLNAIEGLHGYLTQLQVQIGRLVANGIREIASHCWCALLGKCSTPKTSRV